MKLTAHLYPVPMYSRLLPYDFIACIRILLLSTGKKIVPNGQQRKTLEVCKEGDQDKKVDIRGSKWYWAGRNCVIKNFIIIYLVPIKNSLDEHMKDKSAKRLCHISCMRENTETRKKLWSKNRKVRVLLKHRRNTTIGRKEIS